MLSQLWELIPGAEHWPRFARNLSSQSEARLVMLEVVESPSILFRGMAGSRLPIPVAHGEGRVQHRSSESAAQAQLTARYVDGYGQPTERYPANPNGSEAGATAFTSTDGRATIMMPHPERAFRTCQFSWHPEEWEGDSPWMQIFHNAHSWALSQRK